MDNLENNKAPYIVLARLSYSLDVNDYIETLETHDISYQLTGLGIDDSSLEYLTIWVSSKEYDRANQLIRSDHDYFVKCPKCSSTDIRLNNKVNIKNTFLGLIKVFITGNGKHGFNQSICNECGNNF